jgi:hypothetical protein
MRIPSRFRPFLLSALLLCSLSPAATYGTNAGAASGRRFIDEAIAGRCVPAAAKDVLRSWVHEIRSEPTVEDARARLLTQTELARRALTTAAWILPSSESIREAHNEIATLERSVYAANTQGEVADDVLRMLADDAEASPGDGNAESPLLVVAASDLDQSAVRFGGDGGGCDYSVGEIIIIVLGFLLFIIPGIIFLVIFC